MIGALRARLRRRAQAWLARRAPRQIGPVTLHRGRVYILPTRAGAYFGLLLVVMLLGAMNYSNSLGFALTFLLAGTGLVCMHHTHRHLVNLRVRPGRTTPAFAGDDAVFRIALDNPTPLHRRALQITWPDDPDPSPPVDVPPHGDAIAHLRVPAPRRGRLVPPRFSVHTEYPMGLFRAWSWLALDTECLVYPQPRGQHALPRTGAGDATGNAVLRAGREDFAGLREYVRGDPPRLIHWKAYPRSGQLLIKQFTDPRERELWLDWTDLGGLDPETRLSQLCRWVLNASVGGATYGLRLPNETIAPASGLSHRDTCLRALALYDIPG